MRFTKMQGAGNDFIVIDNRAGTFAPEHHGDMARAFCRRRISVGADGMMFLEHCRHDSIKMTYYNSDGSLGEMCGNGARCMAKYAYDRGFAGKEMVLETTAGIINAWRITGEMYKVKMNPVTVPPEERMLEAEGKLWKCRYVELGEPGLPHLAVPYPGLETTPERPLFSLGKTLRNHPVLKKGANVNFYEPADRDAFYLRTFERGVEDFTYACGSGAAALGACIAEDRKEQFLRLQMLSKGGSLQVEVYGGAHEPKELFLTGPAVQVYEGSM